LAPQPNKTKQVLAVTEGNSEKNKVWDEARDEVIINHIKHKIYTVPCIINRNRRAQDFCLLQFVPSQKGISVTGSLARNKECPVFLQSVYLVDSI